MNNLPKRSDFSYKEIEKFEDYEYTNCIAYEMSIRNKELKELLKEIVNYPLYEFSPYKDKHNELDEKLEKNYFINFKIRKHIEKSYEEYLKKYHKEFYERRECIQIMKAFRNKEFEKHIIDNITEYEEKVQNYFYNNFERLKFEYDEFTTEEHATHENSRPLIHEVYVVKIDGEFELVDKESPCIAVIENRNFLRFKRPRLSVYKELDKTIKFNINPNLPKKELIAYISKLKDVYDEDNSIIKSPLELLGENFKKADNKKINKKLIADKFFIYDYIKARQEKIKSDNELYSQVYKEEVQNIKNNHELTRKYKEIQLKELKKEFEENTNTRINELFEDIKGFPSATVKRYYYDIKPFIDDCKYKELITRIKQ